MGVGMKNGVGRFIGILRMARCERAAAYLGVGGSESASLVGWGHLYEEHDNASRGINLGVGVRRVVFVGTVCGRWWVLVQCVVHSCLPRDRCMAESRCGAPGRLQQRSGLRRACLCNRCRPGPRCICAS